MNRRNKNNKRKNNKRYQRNVTTTPKVDFRHFRMTQGPNAKTPPNLLTDCTRYIHFKYVVNLQSNGVGLLSYRFNLRNLSRAVNGAGVYEDAVNIGNAFDIYRPIYWCLEYAPIVAINSFSLPPAQLLADWDDDDITNPVTSSAIANGYDNRQIFDLRYKTTAMIGVARINSGYVPGLTVNDPTVVISGGWVDFAKPPTQSIAVLYGEGYPLNLLVGTAFLTLACEIRMFR